MKKKFFVLLLAVLILPTVALLGCGTKNSFAVTVFASSGTYGAVKGDGTYEEGSVVSLTATAKAGSQVVAWVFGGTTQIENGETYKIENFTDENQRVTKSVLTFTCGANTTGSYTAVFEETKMMYVKFHSFFLTTMQDGNGTSLPETSPVLATANVDFSQGSTALSSFYTAEGLELADNVSVVPEGISSVLKLSTYSSLHLQANMQLTFQSAMTPLVCRAEIKFQQNLQGENYTCTYNNGTYKISMKFAIDTQEYYLNFVYKNLAK